jgi:sugar (pentulose or hexulose) kinase
MTADATGLPVITGPIEATVIGNALVQLISLGEVANLAEARQIVAEMGGTEHYEPHETRTAVWQAAYERYQQLK